MHHFHGLSMPKDRFPAIRRAVHSAMTFFDSTSGSRYSGHRCGEFYNADECLLA
jgi:hypothetical protein